MKQHFAATIQGTVVGHPESGHSSGIGRAFVIVRIVHRTGYHDRKTQKWVSTPPMEFDVKCWDQQHILCARDLKPGTEVLIGVRRFVPTLANDDPVITIYPDTIVPIATPASTRTGGRGQRSGDLVVTPHGEKIAADAWPDVVTDLSLVHHG